MSWLWQMALGEADTTTATLSPKSLTNTVQEPETATVGVRLLSDGTLQTNEGGAWVSVGGEWSIPVVPGVGDDFEAQLLRVSGDNVSGPTGYVPLSSTQTWTLSRSSGSASFDGLLQIRRGTTVVQTNITMDVEVTPLVVSLTSVNLFGFAPNPGTGVRLLADGTLQTKQPGAASAWQSRAGEWLTPKVVGAGYEVRLTKNSGTDTTGDLLGAWLTLDQTRSWELDGSFATFDGTLQIRKGSTVEATANVNLSVEDGSF